MIRFVEMIGIDPLSEKPTHFCFWDTVSDRLVIFGDEVVFSSYDEWREATEGWDLQKRCDSLIPARWKT